MEAEKTEGTIWYAACDGGHTVWNGPNRDNYDDANVDAKSHDTAVHGGVETASVLSA